MATRALRGCSPHTSLSPVARFSALDYPILLKAHAAPVVERIHGDMPTLPCALKPLPPQDLTHCGNTDEPEVGPRPKSEVCQGTQQAPSAQLPADPRSSGRETGGGGAGQRCPLGEPQLAPCAGGQPL